MHCKSDHSRTWKVVGFTIPGVCLAGFLVFYSYVLLTADSTRRHAAKLLALGQSVEAQQSLYWLSRFDADDATTNLLLGEIEIRRENYRGAILYLSRIPENVPEAESGLRNLAACLLNDHQLQLAEEVLWKLLRLFPASLPPYRELSVLLQGQLRHDEATDVLLSFLQHHPDPLAEDLLTVLSDLLVAQYSPPGPEECIKYLQVVDSAHPGQMPVMVALAECLVRSGQFAEADELIRRFRQNSWSMRVGLLELESLISQQKVEEAIRLVTLLEAEGASEAGESVSANSDFQILKCRTQELARDYEAALQSLELAARLNTLDRKSMARYARLLQRTGQSTRARQVNEDVHRQAEAELALWHLAGACRDRLPTPSECQEISELLKASGKLEQSRAWQRAADCVNRLQREPDQFSSGASW